MLPPATPEVLAFGRTEVHEMIEKIVETGRPLSVGDLSNLEDQLRLALPEAYRSFLLTYNGGRPKPNAFPIRNLPSNPFGVIQVFFGIDYPVESCSLEWNLSAYRGRISANLLPIACTDGGDLVCLSLFGIDEESVVFWDSYGELEGPGDANIYHVAENFAAFIDGIRSHPDLPPGKT